MAVANPFSLLCSLCGTFLIFELTLVMFFPFSDGIIAETVFFTFCIMNASTISILSLYSFLHDSAYALLQIPAYTTKLNNGE